jgi:ElaB/YqjD/DUF883 family membrane-anchored ribosome-binding protein
MAERISAEQLMDDVAAVIRDAESLLRATASDTGEKIDEARARAEESVRQAKERLAAIEHEAVRRAQVLAGDADTFVRSNPWQAIAIATGVGLLLGLLANRR